MMRIGFLPSDFNPMLLMLGKAEDFRALGGATRSEDVRKTRRLPVVRKIVLNAASSRFSEFDSKHQQFTVDPRRAPQRVLAAYPPDQRSNFGINPWTAADVAGLPAPVGTEAASVPADHGLRLDDDDSVEKRWIQAIQPHHQQAIDVPQWHTLWVLAA